MKKEYDFSKGERGKFFRKDIKINIPIYLEADALEFVKSIAKKRKTDLNTIVNDILKKNKALFKAM